MPAINPQILFSQLKQQFPEVPFEVGSSANGGLSISWDSSDPGNDQVAGFFRAAGLLASSNSNKPGYVQVQAPRNMPKQKRAPQRQQRSASLSFGAQGLWSISDLEVIRTVADRWVSGLRNPGTIAYYAGGMSLLTIATGYLAWVLDIRPSLIFGQHLAAQLSSEWLNPQLLTAVVLLLSITPNLLEFFATGLAAHGNVIVDISIKAALLFDAATDAPMAYAISKAMVRFFVPDTGFWFSLLTIITALPVLLISTVVVEILFLSFLTTFVLLIRRSFEVRRPARRHYG